MENQIARGNDPARFQSLRALGPDPGHRTNGGINPKFQYGASYFAGEIR